MAIVATNISNHLKSAITTQLESFDPNDPTTINEDFFLEAIGVAVADEVNAWIGSGFDPHVHLSPAGGNTGTPTIPS